MDLNPLFTRTEQLQNALERGACVVTPTQRLARQVRLYLRDQMLAENRVANDVCVLPVRQFWNMQLGRAVTRGHVAPVSVLDGFAQKKVWQGIIEQDEAAGLTLLHSFKAAELCQQAFENLLLWRLEPSDRKVSPWFELGDGSSTFLRWRSRFLEYLNARGLSTLEVQLTALLRYRQLRDSGSDLRIVELYLEDLPPLYRALHSTAENCREVTEVSSEYGPTGAFDSTQLEPGAGTAPVGNTRTEDDHGAVGSAASGTMKVAAFVDRRSELEAVARWCRARSQANPKGRYAVVLSDMHRDRYELERLLRREFGTLAQSYERLPVNFATGFPLGQAALIRDAVRVLACFASEVPLNTLIAVLHSRFLPWSTQRSMALLGEGIVGSLRALRSDRIPQFSLRRILGKFWDDSGQSAPWERITRLDSQEGVFRKALLPSKWSQVFPELLESWDWARGRALDSLEFQQLDRWTGALERYAQLDDTLGPLPFEESLEVLRNLVAAEQFQPETPDRGIQILGPLEPTGLSFDAIWVTGLEAQRWPQKPQPNPYLPYRMQVAHKMPRCDADWESRRASRRWASWCATSKDIRASYVTSDDGVEREPSALIKDRREFASRETGGTCASDQRWVRQLESAGREFVQLEPLPLQQREPVAARARAQVLAYQAESPFRAFAEFRLRTSEPEVASVGLHPAERGTMLHDALYRLFAEVTGSEAIRNASDGQLDELCGVTSQIAVQSLPVERRHVIGSSVLAIEQQRLHGLLRNWLRTEAERVGEFLVTEREREGELALGALCFYVRLDRIDTLESGARLVIDYKSGRKESPLNWFADPIKSPQMPLYALIEPASDGISFASLKAGEMGFAGVSLDAHARGIKPYSAFYKKDSMLADTPEQELASHARRKWREHLLDLANAFCDGAIDDQDDGSQFWSESALIRRLDP
ncbi:MAG: PD-(D/E)XK nuclease family protein [Pseudomonadota bacterium]